MYNIKYFFFKIKLKLPKGTGSSMITFVNVYNIWLKMKLGEHFENQDVEETWATDNNLDDSELVDVSHWITEYRDRLAKYNIHE